MKQGEDLVCHLPSSNVRCCTLCLWKLHVERQPGNKPLAASFSLPSLASKHLALLTLEALHNPGASLRRSEQLTWRDQGSRAGIALECLPAHFGVFPQPGHSMVICHLFPVQF